MQIHKIIMIIGFIAYIANSNYSNMIAIQTQLVML